MLSLRLNEAEEAVGAVAEGHCLHFVRGAVWMGNERGSKADKENRKMLRC